MSIGIHTCKARGMFFFKAEYDKVREEVKMMDRETLLLRQEEWRQIRNLEKEVNQLFIHNRGWLFTFSFSQAEMDYHTWIQNKRQERRDEICLIRQRRREAYVTYRSNLIFG